MGLKKWLKGATRIRFDDRTLGNLTKNAAVGAGTIVGGPLGLAIGAGGSALGQATMKGANIGDIIGAGFKGGATTGLLGSAKNLATKAIPGGAPSVSASAPSAGFSPLPNSDISGASFGYTDPTKGVVDKALNVGKGALNFAKDHDTVAGAVLNTGGDLLLGGGQRAANEAEADLLRARADETAYDFERRKARDAQLAPIWSALATTAGNGQPVAANPYLPSGA